MAYLTACSAGFETTPAPIVQFVPLALNAKTALATFDTTALKGSVTLINFWATSCSTCVAEMPSLATVYQEYHPKGYRMIAVAMSYDTPDFVRNFASSRGLPFEVVFDATGGIAQAFNEVKLTPTSYLLDKQGRIAKRYVGAIDPTELKAAINALML